MWTPADTRPASAATAPHRVGLRGPLPARPGAPALLVDIEAQDFAAALGHGLTRSAWPQFGWPAQLPFTLLAAHAAPRALFQPIHRRFNLLLLDTHCAAFGTPRLDPKRIAASGFVVRRWVGPDREQATPDELANPAHWQAWRTGPEGQALGWLPLGDARAMDADPDPAQRPRAATGNARIDTQLHAQRQAALALGGTHADAAEATHTLYPLAPEVAAHAGRTLLFGLVPTQTAPTQVQPQAVDYASARAPGPDRQAFVEHLSPWLRRSAAARNLPAPDAVFDASWLREDETSLAPLSTAKLRRLQFSEFVRQLALEFGLGQAGDEALVALLNQIPLYRWVRIAAIPGVAGERWETEDWACGDFLRRCALLVADDSAPPVMQPQRFGPLPVGWSDAFVAHALSHLEARSQQLRTLQAASGDDTDALYAIRAFVRLKPEHPGCPAQLVWSEPTPLYRVAPWYAHSGAPQARITLPPLDAASLRAMKPNVAFELPPSLAQLLLRNSPESLLGGSAKPGSNLGIGWLCSFSIPIITVCAFIALNVILSLLNIVFRWLPFVKICLPIPTRK
ncbi:MAG: hypothetical protein RJA98_525 [Pseudomonadota bacterium]|jgi:hypothetical protein